MKTTGLFTTHEITIKMRTAHDTFRLIPFGDVHRDSYQCATDQWLTDLAKWREIPNALFLGMGDYHDTYSTSERITLSNKGHLHESSEKKLEKAARRDVLEFCDEIKFMQKSLIGILGGNHFVSFSDGTTSDHMIAREMGSKYLGTCSFIRIVFDWPGNTSKSAQLTIFAHHGTGGGGTLIGGSMNKINAMANFVDADIVLQGHDHRRGVLPLNPIIGLSNCGKSLKIRERQRWIGRTGSYLLAYKSGESSYNVDAGRGPCSLGHIEFELSPRRHGGTEEQLQIHIRGIS